VLTIKERLQENVLKETISSIWKRKIITGTVEAATRDSCLDILQKLLVIEDRGKKQGRHVNTASPVS